MKVYLAGPMMGQPEHGFPRFERACKLLRKTHEVVSPHEVEHGETLETRGTTLTHGEYMRMDLKLLLDCEAIALLDGWEKSKGAMIELQVALWCGLPAYRYKNGRLEQL